MGIEATRKPFKHSIKHTHLTTSLSCLDEIFTLHELERADT